MFWRWNHRHHQHHHNLNLNHQHHHHIDALAGCRSMRVQSTSAVSVVTFDSERRGTSSTTTRRTKKRDQHSNSNNIGGPVREKMQHVLAVLLVLCLYISYAQPICYSKAALQHSAVSAATTTTSAGCAQGGAACDSESAQARAATIKRAPPPTTTTSAAATATTTTTTTTTSTTSTTTTAATNNSNDEHSFNYHSNHSNTSAATLENGNTNINFTSTNLSSTNTNGQHHNNDRKPNRKSAAQQVDIFRGISTSDPAVLATLGPELTTQNDVQNFRLEYNKYKILSHLRIQSDPEKMAPMITDDLRTKLLTTTPNLASFDTRTTNSRHKRSLSCDQIKSNKDACCLENFYVNFTHIGWDKWILYPTGYYANYCRGQCDLSHARYYHSTLLSKYNNVISLCCSPKQMAPLRLLYIDETNKVHEKSIPEMVVESCDCA